MRRLSFSHMRPEVHILDEHFPDFPGTGPAVPLWDIFFFTFDSNCLVHICQWLFGLKRAAMTDRVSLCRGRNTGKQLKKVEKLFIKFEQTSERAGAKAAEMRSSAHAVSVHLNCMLALSCELPRHITELHCSHLKLNRRQMWKQL